MKIMRPPLGVCLGHDWFREYEQIYCIWQEKSVALDD